MTTGEMAAVIARLDAMDRERQEARTEYLVALADIKADLRGLSATMGDRLTALERARERDAGRAEGRGSIGRAVIASAAIAASVSGVLWAVIDHTS